MFDKKIFFTLVGSATISGFIVICTLGQTLYYQKVEAKGSGIIRELPQADFVVREYEGQLGIFRGQSTFPYKVIEYDVSLLSDYDRSQLAAGISFDEEAEMNIFLEDMIT